MVCEFFRYRFTRNHGVEKDESAYLDVFSEQVVVTAHDLGEDSDGAMRSIMGILVWNINTCAIGMLHFGSGNVLKGINLTGCFIFIQDKQYSVEVKVSMLRQMVQAELFKRFLGKRFSGAKRFSIEGGERLISGLCEVLEHPCDHGMEVVQMGMAHRCRLNVLANVLRQHLRSIISQFQPYLPD
ncbi:hypothetical protein PsorP6_006164 [Peronosclerospora sorghi]|uniref:Uncharacterized protein n=1 Tax=Peronosclerospora sorghi TaxID=230839 RepID=A0ACC0W1A5_9STRA|nr:hypothetical protein PsorP6_006164 [Peronosclerospora sorghi]